MSTPILTTKLYIPPVRPNWVPRPRLIKRLDQGLQRKLTLVSAPAGFGKTTLIASWLHGLGDQEQTAPRVAWLSLEADDNDPYRFFTHFVAALQSLDPGAGQAARPFLETPQLPAFDHLMTLLLNDLASLSERSVLVLDDYHAIKQPDLQTAIVFFLDHLPPHCHLVKSRRCHCLVCVCVGRSQRSACKIYASPEKRRRRFSIEPWASLFPPSRRRRSNAAPKGGPQGCKWRPSPCGDGRGRKAQTRRPWTLSLSTADTITSSITWPQRSCGNSRRKFAPSCARPRSSIASMRRYATPSPGGATLRRCSPTWRRPISFSFLLTTSVNGIATIISSLI